MFAATDGAGVVRLRGHARVAERHEPAARAARQRGAGARARGAQRRHERRLDHGHRPVQHDRSWTRIRRTACSRSLRAPSRGSRIPSRSCCGSTQARGRRRAPTRSTARIARRRGRRGPRPTIRFPVVLVRDPAALAGLVAAVRKQATAASPFIMLERPIDGTPYQIVAHALFASGPPHALLGFMAFTVNEQWLHAQYFDPLVEQVAKIGGGRGGLSITVSDDEGRVGDEGGAGRARRRRRSAHAVPAPVHRSGARQVDLRRARRESASGRCTSGRCRIRRSSRRSRARGGCSS